ncbi:MAG TPA: hypothetical protein VK465_12500, partial [Fibrobacteria bacterium]|nr:hypothetical protein [Fibrobacteria bacterium]
MRHVAVFVSWAFSAGLPALALDVSGKVYDKLLNPVPGAKACVKGDPNTCATTDTEGAFHLTETVALRPQRTGESGFSLTYRGGSLIVRSPVDVAARLEWLSADGRRRWAAHEADLTPGANAIPLPLGLPRAGLVLLRLFTPGQVLNCKAFLASGTTIAGEVSTGAPAIIALSKVAASALEISKAGYRTRTYLPAAETEFDVAIFLSDTADADTATAGGMAGPFVNDFGASTNLSLHGPMTTSNEFFKPFGNGRACVSCHRPQDGFSITPKSLQALFHVCGLDTDDPSQRPSQADSTGCAVFRTNDGSVSATADVSTAAARRKAYSLLLSRGLIHLTFPVPAGAQFDVVAVNDPYGVATKSTLSVYR